MRIVRARRGLGMILHAEDRLAAVTKSLQRLIVQIHVGNFDVALVERIRVDGETVVVRRNFDTLREPVDDRVIGAAMPELQLVGFAAESQSENLVPEANAENGRFSHQAAHIVDLRMERFGIARAVGKKHAVRFQRENVFG